MHCYDCAQEGRENAAGIGACTRCGLFACDEHARIVREDVQRLNGLGRTSGGAVRRLVCASCSPVALVH
ncbi:DUF2180 family protein [Streptomyces sp. NPDC090306]|uniref:DUF2180 family protein n=1 Tax=unclassified Streptomyces TaxID=2593676 RepID=UPI0036E36805